MRALTVFLCMCCGALAQAAPSADLAFGTWRLANISGGFAGVSYDPGPTYHVLSVAREAQGSGSIVETSNDTFLSVFRCDTSVLIAKLLTFSLGPHTQWVGSPVLLYFSDTAYAQWDGIIDGYAYRYEKVGTSRTMRPVAPGRSARVTTRAASTPAVDLAGRRAVPWTAGIAVRPAASSGAYAAPMFSAGRHQTRGD
jgi:hypothetical protein